MNQTVYSQVSGGIREYWTYCDGQRVFISAKIAAHIVGSGEKLVNL